MLTPIGITERGDASLDLSWVSKLKPVNIIISKGFNPIFNEALLANKDKIIYHCTCTGFGGSIIEPNVPTPQAMYDNLHNLIKAGFPPSQIVLRIDPIVPTKKGLQTFESIIQLFSPLPIKRIRFSFLDMYSHVKLRFKSNNIRLPYTTFSAPTSDIHSALQIIAKYEKYFEFESCAENTKYQRGCISDKDLLILNKNIYLYSYSHQRRDCLCPSNKHELLCNAKQCDHGCLYCYWR